MKRKILTLLPIIVTSIIVYSCNNDRIEESTNKKPNEYSQIKSIEVTASKEKYNFSYTPKGALQSMSDDIVNKKGVFIYDSSDKLIAIKSNKIITEFTYSGNQISKISSKTTDGKVNILRSISYKNGGNTIQIDSELNNSSQLFKEVFQFENGNLISADVDGQQLKYYYDDKINPFYIINKDVALLSAFAFGNMGGAYQASKNNLTKIERKNKENQTFSIYKDIENVYDSKERIVKMIDKANDAIINIYYN